MILLYGDLIGKRFEFNGRDPHYDCVGLMIEIHRRLGNEIADPLEVYCEGQEITEEALERCAEQFRECGRPYEKGDVFMIASGHHGEMMDHVAIYVGQGRCIQTAAGLGVVTTEVSKVERRTRKVLRYAQNHDR